MRSGLVHFRPTASWKSKDWRERTRSVRGICAYRKINREGVAVQGKGKGGDVRVCVWWRNSEFLLLRPGKLPGHNPRVKPANPGCPLHQVGTQRSTLHRFFFSLSTCICHYRDEPSHCPLSHFTMRLDRLVFTPPGNNLWNIGVPFLPTYPFGILTGALRSFYSLSPFSPNPLAVASTRRG